MQPTSPSKCQVAIAIPIDTVAGLKKCEPGARKPQPPGLPQTSLLIRLGQLEQGEQSFLLKETTIYTEQECTTSCNHQATVIFRMTKAIMHGCENTM